MSNEIMDHSELHEEFLQRILTGDLDPEGEEAQRQLDHCADCRRELEEMRALLSELDAAGAFERSVLEEASGLEDAPGLADVERVLKAEMAGASVEAPILSGPRPAARSRFAIWVAALAAAVLVVFVLQGVLDSGSGTNGGEMRMGVDSVDLIRPLETGDGFGTFEWDFDLPAGWSFDVVVYDADPEASTEPLHRERDLTENRWTPDEKLIAEWRSIRWYVEVIDESGELDRVAQPATVDSH